MRFFCGLREAGRAGRHYSQAASKWTSTWRLRDPLFCHSTLLFSESLFLAPSLWSLDAHAHPSLFNTPLPSNSLPLLLLPLVLLSNLQAVVWEDANWMRNLDAALRYLECPSKVHLNAEREKTFYSLPSRALYHLFLGINICLHSYVVGQVTEEVNF